MNCELCGKKRIRPDGSPGGVDAPGVCDRCRTASPKRCRERVFVRALDCAHPCGKNASIQEGERWYCKTHAPSTRKAKRDASRGKYRNEVAAERERRERDETARRIGEGVQSIPIGLGIRIFHATDRWEARTDAMRICGGATLLEALIAAGLAE